MDPILSIVLSAAVGCILPYIIKSIVGTLRRMRKTSICGNWYVYLCWTMDGYVSTDMQSATITRHFPAEYHACFTDEKKYHYEGEGHIENGYFCIDMKSKNFVSNETTHHRYNLAKIQETGMCFGFWLSTNANNHISCGSVILTREKINEGKLDGLIKNNYIIHEGMPTISLKW